MAKIDSDKLSKIVNAAALLVQEHDLAGAKRLLMQVPPSQLFEVAQDFRGLPR